MDMYRNPKTVRKEIQRKRLEELVKLPRGTKLNPQDYPDIFYDESRLKLAEFEHHRLIKQNIGTGIWEALYKDYQNPAEQHQDEVHSGSTRASQ